MTTRWEVERAVLRSDLKAPARLIMLVLCSVSKAETAVVPREHTPSLSMLADLTGLSRRSVADHLNVLEAGRWVIRSRPSVTQAQIEKERTQYRLSVPASARAALARPIGPGVASAPRAPASAGGAPELVQEVHWASAPVAHKTDRSKPTEPPARTASPEQIVRDATGCSPAEAAAIANRVRNERQPRSLPGLLRRMAADGDLADLLTDCRAARQRDEVAAALAKIRDGPLCSHHVPGGASPHPVSGEPVCPQCRFAARFPKPA